MEVYKPLNGDNVKNDEYADMVVQDIFSNEEDEDDDTDLLRLTTRNSTSKIDLDVWRNMSLPTRRYSGREEGIAGIEWDYQKCSVWD